MKYSIGVDIGGTNTDAVLVDHKGSIIHSVKAATTYPLDQGFCNALEDLLSSFHEPKTTISKIIVGTTHATNAILECQELYRVGVIRIAGHRPEILPPGYGWPSPLRQQVIEKTVVIGGGFECDGRPITEFKSEEVKLAALQLLDQGAESIAICGVFSPLYAKQEIRVAEIISKTLDNEIPLSLSSLIGGLGYIERENATILNAALKKVMQGGFKSLKEACLKTSLHCPLFITQNNGSLITLEEALEYPVLTISAGPTNSFVGGAKLTGLHDALVVDIGGTSTDVGIIKKGFPRRCLHHSTIGGISLNFSMPDVLAVALGGGSHVHLNGDQTTVGPQSVSKRLLKEGISFGGKQLTLTDISLALGYTKIAQAKYNCSIEDEVGKKIMCSVGKRINYLVSQMEGEKKNLPVVLVGGGASLIPLEFLGDRFVMPEHCAVANAYGAALAEVSVTLNEVISLSEREQKLHLLQEQVLKELTKKGGDPHKGRIIDVTLLPYFYMPGNLARVTVVGAAPQAL